MMPEPLGCPQPPPRPPKLSASSLASRNFDGHPCKLSMAPTVVENIYISPAGCKEESSYTGSSSARSPCKPVPPPRPFKASFKINSVQRRWTSAIAQKDQPDSDGIMEGKDARASVRSAVGSQQLPLVLARLPSDVWCTVNNGTGDDDSCSGVTADQSSPYPPAPPPKPRPVSGTSIREIKERLSAAAGHPNNSALPIYDNRSCGVRKTAPQPLRPHGMTLGTVKCDRSVSSGPSSLPVISAASESSPSAPSPSCSGCSLSSLTSSSGNVHNGSASTSKKKPRAADPPKQVEEDAVYVSSATSTIYIGPDVVSHDPSDYDLPEERHRSSRARSESGRSAVLKQTCVEADNEESQELSVWMENEAGDADDEWVDDGHLYEALESHYEHVEAPETIGDVTTASDQHDKSHVEPCDIDREVDSEDPEGLEDQDPDSKKHGMQKLADAADGMKKKLKKNWRMTKSGINRMRIKSLSSGIDPAVLQVAAALPAKPDWQKRSKKKKHKQKDDEGIYQVLDKSTFYLDLVQLPASLPSTPVHLPASPAEVGFESDTTSSARSSVTLEGSDLQQLTSGEVTPTDCRRLSAQSYGEASARRISQVIPRPRASPPAPPLPLSVSSSVGQTLTSPATPSAAQTATSVSCSTGQTTTSPVSLAESQTATVPVTPCTGPAQASLVNSAGSPSLPIATPLLATSTKSNEVPPTGAGGASSQTHSALLLRSRSLHEESPSLSTLRAVASTDGNGLTSSVAKSQPSLLPSDSDVDRDLSEYTPSDESKSEEELYTSLLDKEPLYQLYMQGRCQEGVYSSGSSTSSDSGYEMVTSLEHLPVQLCVPPPPLPPPPPPCRQPHRQLPPPVRSSTIQLASQPSAEGQRSLWCQLPEVISSHVIETMTSEGRRLQEAIFEIISSEASYLKSLTVLINNFAEEPLFSNFDSPDCIISKTDYKDLFSNAHKVLLCSERFLADLERKWQQDIMMSGVCDVIETHASLHFGVYKHYCANQVIQDRKLKQLKEKNVMFAECLQRLESSAVCQSLNLHSFLMLPMQRVTRLPLLVSAVLCRLDTGHPQFSCWQKTYQTVKNLAESCNEEASKNERLEELVSLNRQLVFKDMKSFPLVASHRWLVKKGEMTRTVFKGDDFKVTFGRKQTRQQTVHLFLFTDLLVISKKKGDETYVVLDYCMRNMIELTENIEDRPEKFLLTLLSNYEDKTVEMLFTCPLESERLRWMEAVTPRVQRSDTEEVIYESWDCPQVRVVQPHTAQQSDELTLQEGEVLKVLRKVPDGWYEGMKLSDNVSGWFPGHCCQEVVSEHVRARHLRQRYQLLQITGNFLQQQKQLQKRSKTDKTDAPGVPQ